jgi:RHS repeat-associated protein
MESNTKVLGMKKTVVDLMHKVMLVAMLYSTMTATSQHMLNDYFNAKTPLHYTGFGSVETQTGRQDAINLPQNPATPLDQPLPHASDYGNASGTSRPDVLAFVSDIDHGYIGVTGKSPLDDTGDNTFTISVAQLPAGNDKVLLTYELYGVQDLNGVSRSINDRLATGGYIVKEQPFWSVQKEEINCKWLRVGKNKITFGIPAGANYQYQIRNLRIQVVRQPLGAGSLIVNKPQIQYVKDNHVYVKGFVKNAGTALKVFLENTPLTVINGEYEGFCTISAEMKQRQFAVIRAVDATGLLGQDLISLDNIAEADWSFVPEKIFDKVSMLMEVAAGGMVKTDGACLTVTAGALPATSELQIIRLRKVDIAPMGSGMINVTKGGGYRFLPDGMKFKNPVSIAIDYDQALLPAGYTPKDIKTFYFNTDTKSWVAVQTDSVSEIDHAVISKTIHFTDYINGIIQVPESPETAGFAPTMMNDIKAADPSSEITLISPPVVSQKGDANISYPIKIPAGRKGMQPQLAISYSNQGANGWLGLGWGLSVPALTIDTRWGVPLLSSQNETEIYTLNGEQLMYPKFNGNDWMPNRHYDTPNSNISTAPRPRIANADNITPFTPRKQGSFAKIERLGNSPSTYYWKVTGTDGTINWYGARQSSDLTDPNGANAVLKQDASGGIVHWALFMTEDVYGNNIKYYYNITTIGTSSAHPNLVQGKQLKLSKIVYTGFNDEPGGYEVNFHTQISIKDDATIDGRLGTKLVDAFLLSDITVRKVGANQVIRKYNFGYIPGRLGKNLLGFVSESDNDKEFYRHTFEYYNDIPNTGNDVFFSAGVDVNVCGDVYSHCPDADEDGVCDENDQCVNIFGSQENHGCPETGHCYSINMSNTGNLRTVFNAPEPVSAILNGVEMPGSPFDTFAAFLSAMLAQCPGSSYNGSVFMIPNTMQQYTTLQLFNGVDAASDFVFLECPQQNINQKRNYRSFFGSQLDNFTAEYHGSGTFGDPECPSFLNVDFLVQGDIPAYDSSLALLGTSSTDSANAGGYLGFGIGCNPLTKSSTFGWQWTWSKDRSGSKTALVDINGDGLDDVVIDEGGTLYYKAHEVIRAYDSDNSPVITHTFAPKKPISGISNFYRATGSSKSGNFQVTLGIHSFGGFIGKDKAKSESSTNIYFSDGNGDGLVDIVKNGVVYFNRLDANKNPKFGASSWDSENLVIKAGVMNVDVPADEDEEDFTIPAYDVIKVWEAPAAGTIVIDNDILLTDTSKEAVVTVEMRRVSGDIDNDGVLDEDDHCPEVPGSVDNFGCLYCFEAKGSFPLIPSRYKYMINNDIAPEIAGCFYVAPKVLSATVNGVVSNAPQDYIMAHCTAGVITDRCPGTFTSVPNHIIENPDFTNATGISSWLRNTVFPAYLDSGSNFQVFDNSFVHIQNASNVTHFGWGFEFESVNPALTDVNLHSELVNPITGNYEFPGIFQTGGAKQVISGDSYAVPVSVDGFSLGNFDLLADPASLVLAIEAHFGGDAEISTSISPIVPLSDPFNETGEVTISIANQINPITTVTINGITYNVGPCSKKPVTTDREAQLSLDGPSQRLVNPVTCNDISTPLCLLYGATLSQSNPHISVSLDNTGTMLCSSANNTPLNVRKGDRIYFRLHSVANGNPPVEWDPFIKYTNNNMGLVIDQNNLTPYSNKYSDGFILSRKMPATFPGNNGTAQITWTPFNVNNPTDDVTFDIIQREMNATGNDDDATFTETNIYHYICYANQSFPANGTNHVAPSAPLASIPLSFPVNGTDLSTHQFYFRVTSSSNVDWKQYEWKPVISSEVNTDVQGEPDEAGQTQPDGFITTTQKIYPVVDYSIYKSFGCSPKYALFDVTPVNGGVGLWVRPFLSGIFHAGDKGQFYFVVKGNGHFLGRILVTVATTQPFNQLSITTDTQDGIVIPAGTGEIEIGYYIDDSDLFDAQASLMRRLANASLTARLFFNSGGNVQHFNIPSDYINFFQKPNPKFGPMLRQWGQFMYNQAVVANAQSSPYGNLIKESALIYDQAYANSVYSAITGLNENNITEANIDAIAANNASLVNAPFLSANPSRTEVSPGIFDERWTGLYSESYASAGAFRAATMEQNFGSQFDPEPYEFQDVAEFGAYGINKITRGKNKNFSGGVSIELPVTIGASASKTLSGDNRTITDYVDFNGDRYPDIVTATQIQYTNRTGGLTLAVDRSGDLSNATSSNWGLGAQASFSKGGDTGGSTNCTESFHRFEGFRGNSGGALSGNFSKGRSLTNTLWTDINGDGLTDFVHKDAAGNVLVDLTLGYATDSTPSGWNLPGIFDSAATNISAGTGFSKWNGSVELGLSMTSAWNNMQSTLVDMNGDGLLDFVNTGNGINVSLNSGNKFVPFSQQWSSRNAKGQSVSVGGTINGTATIALVWPIPFLGFCLKAPALSFSGSKGVTSNKTKKTISDFDGDGYPDLLEEVGHNQLRVYSSTIRRTDMLKAVNNPLGGNFVVDYKVQSVDYDNPNARWNMSQVAVNDGYDNNHDGRDTYVNNFVYEDGRYDRRERMFYGYATVRTLDMDLDDDNVPIGIYRSSVSEYNNTSYFLHGLLESSYVAAGDSQVKFSETVNKYEIRQLGADNQSLTAIGLPDTFDVGGTNGRRTAAVVLGSSVTRVYEQATTPIESVSSMQYDSRGRVSRYDYSANGSAYSTEISYHEIPALHIMDIPEELRVTSGGVTYRHKKTNIDGIGNIEKIVTDIDGSTQAVTTMAYNSFGNLEYIEFPQNSADPMNGNGQSMFYKYTYDTVYNKYVTAIDDVYNYSSSATYNSDFDKVESTEDRAGNKMIYKYDSFGRTAMILAPKEITVSAPYTIEFRYFPLFANFSQDQQYADCMTDENKFMPVALTSHYDPQHPDNRIQTITFIDGLGRVAQVKKDIELNKGTAHAPEYYEAMSVSGKVRYDQYGRAVEQFHPLFEDKDCKLNFYINEVDSPHSSITDLDLVDRPVKIFDPVGNDTQISYALEADNTGTIGLKTKTDVNQNGSQHVVTETFKDISGKAIATKNEGGQSGAIWTNFKYNAIGELMSYEDTEHLVTEYTYDMVGKKVVVKNPDNGVTTFQYDGSGNMIKLQTANLAAAGNVINYKYYYNRLTDITYPDVAGLPNVANVHYEYGETGSGIGRVVCQSDATGRQEFDYGNMGEVIYNRRLVQGPNIPDRVFVTAFRYDSWNRIEQLDYPDGEKVTYSYNLGGCLNKMSGTVGTAPYNYIERIDYDEYEQRAYMLYGNKTETYYAYSADLRRLENLRVLTPNGSELMNDKYGYDNIGNILSMENVAGISATNFGGAFRNVYGYDSLNRLTEASGEFNGSPTQLAYDNDQSGSYSLKMEYNDTHGIKLKSQEHIKNGAIFTPNTYANDYKYYPDTHRVSDVTGTNGTTSFSYDENGNTTKKVGIGYTQLLWDESNRLRVIADDKSMQHYIYDAAGERVLKANTDIESVDANGMLLDVPNVTVNSYTTYPNPYIVVNPHGTFSKHYYAGTQRIVSRMADAMANIFDNTENIPAVCTGGEAKLKQRQIADLQEMVSKTRFKKAAFKEFKPYASDDAGKGPGEDESGEDADAVHPVVTGPDGVVPVDPGENAVDPGGDPDPRLAQVYFYHPDHLGSSTFLTDFNGNAYQFYLNLPFGETMVEQRPYSSGYETPYKFNGKELDEETGLYYYGARYYDPQISIWYSVDPLTEQFPNMSPYNFCNDNPIVFTDPTGMAPDGWIEHLDSKGNTAVTYHPGVDTKEQAEAAGYKGVSAVFQSGSITGTAPDGSSYSYRLNANATVTNSQGQTTDQGFATPNGTWVAENPIGRYNMFFNGAKNFGLGIVGSAGAIAAIPETGGGSAFALTLTINETGMGFGQMLNAFQTNVDGDLQSFSTLPGLGAARAGCQYAPLIDGISGWATGSISHPSLFGNTLGTRDACEGLRDGQEIFMNSFQLLDTYFDGKGLRDGVKEPKR